MREGTEWNKKRGFFIQGEISQYCQLYAAYLCVDYQKADNTIRHTVFRFFQRLQSMKHYLKTLQSSDGFHCKGHMVNTHNVS